MAIAPAGWRASLGCIGYGLATGRRCIISCGPIMVAMTLCPRNAVIAIAVTALLMGSAIVRGSNIWLYLRRLRGDRDRSGAANL